MMFWIGIASSKGPNPRTYVAMMLAGPGSVGCSLATMGMIAPTVMIVRATAQVRAMRKAMRRMRGRRATWGGTRSRMECMTKLSVQGRRMVDCRVEGERGRHGRTGSKVKSGRVSAGHWT